MGLKTVHRTVFSAPRAPTRAPHPTHSLIIYLKRFRDWPPPFFERGKYL